MSDKVLSFSFKYFTKGKITKEIKKLDSKKACQESDILKLRNNKILRTKKCKCDTYFRKKRSI